MKNGNGVITQLVPNMPDASARSYSLPPVDPDGSTLLVRIVGSAGLCVLRYHTWLYETLRAEMARNAFTYPTKGIKLLLLPTNCKQKRISCTGAVDVYRWEAKRDATRKPVYGTDP